MKALKFILALVVMISTFTFTANADNKQKKDAEVTYKVNLHCASCQKKVEAALPYIKGVKDMKVNLADKTVWLKYDQSKTSKETLAAELKKLGYPAAEVAPAAKDEKKK